MSDQLAKRDSGEQGLTKRAPKKRKAAAELEVKSVAQPQEGTIQSLGDVAQATVTSAETQANQLAELEVRAFVEQAQRNAPVVAKTKAQAAAEILGIMSDVWADAMSTDQLEVE